MYPCKNSFGLKFRNFLFQEQDAQEIYLIVKMQQIPLFANLLKEKTVRFHSNTMENLMILALILTTEEHHGVIIQMKVFPTATARKNGVLVQR